MMTHLADVPRDEHLYFCKRRALGYLEIGDLINAVASMGSDMSKHPETQMSEDDLAAGMLAALHGGDDAVRAWIEAFK